MAVMKDTARGIDSELEFPHLISVIRNPIRAIRGRLVFGRWNINIYGDYSVITPRNVSVGANLTVSHGVFILGRNGIVIGDNVILSARCMLLDGGPLGNGNAKVYKNSMDSKIEIGNNVLVGAGAIILPGVKIGDGAIVAAGALVTQDVGPGDTVAGNPARRCR